MLRKRVKQLTIFYVIAIMLFATFGVFYNVLAKEYSSDQTSDNVLKVGTILTKDDTIKLESSYTIYYYDNSDNFLTKVYGTGDETLPIRDYFSTDSIGWQIVKYKMYYTHIIGYILKPAYNVIITNPKDQTVKNGDSATYNISAKSHSNNTLNYIWYNVSSKTETLAPTSISNITSTTADNVTEYKNSTTDNKTSILYFDNINANMDDVLSFTINRINCNLSITSDNNNSYDKYYNYDVATEEKTYNITFTQSGTYDFTFRSTINSGDSIILSDFKLKRTIYNALVSDTNTLKVSPTENSDYYKTDNKFMCQVIDGDITYSSTSANLTVNTTSTNFTDPTSSSEIDSTTPLPIEYELRVKKLDKYATTKLTSQIGTKSLVNVYEVGMYNGNVLVDVGKGDYTVHLRKDNTMSLYNNIQIAEIDSNNNIIAKKETTSDSKYLTYKTTELHNIVLVGDKIVNPLTGDVMYAVIEMLILLIVATITVIYYTKFKSLKE